MNKLILLVKTFLRQKYRIDKAAKKSKTIVLIIVLGVCMLPMAAIMAIAFFAVGQLAAELGIQREMLTFFITGTQVVVLMFGLVALLNTVYLSKDTELMLALPASSATVYAAKLIYVFIQEIIANFAIILLLLLPFGIGARVQWWYYFQLIPTVIISPMLPLLLASIIAIPLMWIVGFFKNKGAISTVFYLLIFTALMGGYYTFIFSLQSGPGADVEMGEAIASLIQRYSQYAPYIYPNFLLAGSLVATSAGGYFGGLFGSLGINLVLAAIAVLISSAVYRSSIAKRLETPKNAVKGQANTDYKPKGKVRAIMRNDFKQIVRDTQIGTSIGMGLVLMPIMAVIMFFAITSDSSIMQDEIVTNIMRVAFVGVMSGFFGFMALSCNIAACSSFSREGQKVYIYKALPIDANTLTRAKVTFSALYNVIQAVLTGIVLAIVLKADFLSGLFGIVIMWGVCYASGNVSIYVDMAKPRLTWNTFNEGVKNNPASLSSLATGFGVMVVYSGLAVGMGVWYYNTAFAPYVLVVYYSVALLITAIYCVITRKILSNNCARLYKRMGE